MEIKPSNPKIVHHCRGVRDRAGRARGHARDRRAAARVRGRQVRRHLRREHRPAAEGGDAAALRHALLRDRERSSTTARPSRSSSIRRAYVPKYQVRSHADSQHSERRARDSAEHGGPDRRLFPSAAQRAHRRVPAAHAHARPRDDARSDQSGQHHDRSSARSITSISTGTSTTSTPTTWRRCCRPARCCT